MDIQFVKISLSAEESDKALPIVMRAIAAAPATMPAPVDFGAVPAAFQSPAVPEPKQISSATVLAPPTSSEPSAVDRLAKIQVAPPTGSVAKAQAMIFDDSLGRYRQRSLWDRLINWGHWTDRWLLNHQRLLAVSLGSAVGFGILYACIRFEVPDRIYQRFVTTDSPALVEPTEETTAPTESEANPSNDLPADASDKAGQPAKLPLSEGAIK